jgi:hypothetical protein
VPVCEHLYAFMCLSLHFKQVKMEKYVKFYYNQWRLFKGVNVLPEDCYEYRELQLHELAEFEKCFKVRIGVYELLQNGAVIPHYRPESAFEDIMYLNLFEHHLSFVTDFKVYAKKFQCLMCQRHFNQSYLIKRHLKSCSNVTKFKFVNGAFQASKGIFEQLDEFGIYVKPEDRFFEHFAAYDFEAILKKIKHQGEGKLKYTHQHIPISVSVISS